MRWMIALFALGCAASSGTGTKEELDPDERRIAMFSKLDDFDDAKISPDGKLIAVTSRSGGEGTLVFMRADTLEVLNGFRFQGTQTIYRLDWAKDDLVVVELAEQFGPLDQPGRTGELVAIGVDGSRKPIFGWRSGQAQIGSHLRKAEAIHAFGEVIDPLPNDPRKILVRSERWTSGGKLSGLIEVYSVDVRSGVKDKVTAGPGYVEYYVTDEKGALRLALELANDATLIPHWLDEAKGEWRRLDALAPISRFGRPIGFSSTSRTLYVVDEDADGPALYEVSIDSGDKRVLFREKDAAPRQVLFDPEKGTPVAVEYEPDYPKWKVLDESRPLAKVLAKASLPGQHVRITSTTRDGSRAMVIIYGDRTPPIFALVDANESKPLLSARAGVDPLSMSPMEAFKIKASDGLGIHGYLTLPGGKDSKLPMVVMVHGGPHGPYDEWRFHPEAQLFADFGFAVLQVNFRGSGGYGQKFVESGYRRWGDRIQDDIIDATRWAIAEGIADPARICIFGGSFGGYSALQSAARAPDLFRCAIGYAGVYDLEMLYSEGDIKLTARGRGYLSRVVGEDPEELRKASPVHQADALKAPVLLVHGGDDKRAPIAHAEAMKEALEKRSKKVETLFVGNEGHGFYEEPNRLRAYQRILQFIEANTR